MLEGVVLGNGKEGRDRARRWRHELALDPIELSTEAHREFPVCVPLSFVLLI